MGKSLTVDTFTAILRDELLQARKQRDEMTSQTLLSLLNAIDNAGAVAAPTDSTVTEVARRELSINDVKAIIADEIAEMERALELYRLSNVAEMANEMMVRIEIMRRLQDRAQ